MFGFPRATGEREVELTGGGAAAKPAAAFGLGGVCTVWPGRWWFFFSHVD